MTNLYDKLKNVRCVLLDVDGVMTDGRFGYTTNPDEEIKFFNAKDGHAIKMALWGGLKVGVISGRRSAANRKRFEELNLSFFYERQKDKLACFEKMLEEHGFTAEECIYVGDDVIDMPLLRRCAVGIAVADAVPEVLEMADHITTANGGYGAVREVLVEVLKAKGLWDELMQVNLR